MFRRLLGIALLLWLAAFAGVFGKIVPLTINDICLMLRSGYSSDAIQKDLATRHFVGAFDAGAEKSLRNAGAAPALVEALKSGSYTISAGETQAVEAEIAAQAQQRAAVAAASQKVNALYQDQLRRSRAAAAARAATAGTKPAAMIADLVKGDLVSWKDGSLSRFDDEVLGGKQWIALYFSARWCGPCRNFTPKLVEFYNRVSQQHPEFEILFFSNDRSPGEMETYMREDKMPWPAIDFGKLSGKGALKKYEGDGIPCLVLLDSAGNVISDSHSGKTYVGPEKVMSDIEKILTKGSSPATASR
jgi:nucleoredoxin